MIDKATTFHILEISLIKATFSLNHFDFNIYQSKKVNL